MTKLLDCSACLQGLLQARHTTVGIEARMSKVVPGCTTCHQNRRNATREIGASRLGVLGMELLGALF